MSDSTDSRSGDGTAFVSVPDADRRYMLFGEIAEEIKHHLEQGREPDVESLVVAHPELELSIRQLIPALHVLHNGAESVAQSPDTASAESLLPPARRLGDYHIVRQIGHGGMGIVFEAEQVSLRRRVAVKMLPLSAAWDDHRLRRFQNEAQAAARLHHQNIVPVYTIGCQQGVHYFAMQYLDGRTLAEIIAEMRQTARGDGSCLAQPLAGGDSQATTCRADQLPGCEWPADGAGACDRPSESGADGSRSTGGSRPTRRFLRYVAELGIQAARGLEHAHQHQVIHRDIKPSNLLVEPSGHLWITDFGVAQFPGDEELTITGDVVGTARYMSPEQTRPQSVAVDHRSDIYSLGVTLYELLTLQPAIGGRTYEEIMRQIDQYEPRRPRRINRSIPVDLETIVLKAMAKDPAARYASARHMADDLQRYLNDEPVLAKRPSWARISQAYVRRHRRSLIAAALSAATVTVLLALVAFYAPRPDPPALQAQREASEGVRLTGAGRHQEAIAHLTKALQLDPTNDRIWVDRAACYRDFGQFTLAYEDLTSALTLRRDLPTLYSRAVVGRTLERWDAVAADYGELFRYSLLTDPATLGLFNLKRQVVQKQLETHPDAVWLWVVEAVHKTRSNDTAGAVDDLQHAFELAPDTHWILGHIGSLRLYRGEYDEAIATLSHAIRLQQDCAAYWTHRAAARGYLGQFDDAVSDVAQAIQLAPHDAVPLQVRGCLYAKAGQTEAAIADFEASLQLDPAGETQMWSWFANAIRRRGTTDADRRFAEDFLRRNPDHAVAHAHWGNVCLYAGQTEQGLESLLTASYMKPRDQFIKRKCFEALLALNDLPRAIEIQGELARGTTGAANWRSLAELHYMAGQVDVYRSTCQRLLQTKLMPLPAGSVALTCAESPDFQAYPPQIRTLVDATIQQHPLVPMYLAGGAVCYRLGDFVAAQGYLEHAVRATADWQNAFDEFLGTEAAFFLAMARHKAGRPTRSPRSTSPAPAWLN